MALWPFRRKSRRKRPYNPDDPRGRTAAPQALTRGQTVPDLTATGDSPTSAQQLRKQATEPNKLHRRARTYSFSPGRHESIRVGRKRSTRAKRERAPLPAHAAGDNPDASFIHSHDDDGEKEYSGLASLGYDVFQRVPTLHNKRDGDHLPRKKSSKKRRKNDNEREAEIKAMSNFVPHRPATDDWAAGRPMKRETRRVRTGLGLGFRGDARHEWDKENRSSDISLPVPESIDSNLSSDSEHISFKVSALEALAPRPTLRYSTAPRWGPGSGDGALARQISQRRKFSERSPIPEATLRAHKRIDDLADDMNASDLRELMERDTRRRERKRQSEQERVEKRLARRAEKQRAAEAAAVREGRDSPPNLERGVLGRETVGLGIDPTSAVVTSSRRRPSGTSPKRRDEPDGEDDTAEGAARPHPFDTFHRPDSIAVDQVLSTPAQEPEAPAPLPPSPTFRNVIRSKKSRSKSPQTPEPKSESSTTPRKTSERRSSRGAMAWTSIFRWGNKKHSSDEPSSFSNTSRDSMQTSQIPTPPVAFVPRKLSSAVPKRTMSRFREDLPELPISPPDSGAESPGPGPIPPTITEASPDPQMMTGEAVGSSDAQAAAIGTPTSDRRSIDIAGQTPTSITHSYPPGISPEPQTGISLASIDSEGSWLSGRLRQRGSSSAAIDSAPRINFTRPESGSDHHNVHEHELTNEDISIADDEYLSQFAHGSSDAAAWNRKSTGEARPSSDEDDDARWGSVGGKQPMVVHDHPAERMKSREVLLNSFGDDDQSDGEISDGREEGEGLQRATSINLGKGHVRHISAGSAKLLNLSPRSSVDAKRRSLSPQPQES